MRLHLFNPTCDFAIANELPTWQPNKILQKMEQDLDTLPVYLASKDDKIIVHKLPSKRFIRQLKRLNLSAGFITSSNIDCIKQPFILQPWGWSPVIKKMYEDSFEDIHFFNRLKVDFNPQTKYYFSRAFSKDIVTLFLEKTTSANCYISKKYFPQIATSQEQITALFKEWRQIVLKFPWSSSGRGLIFLRKDNIHQKIWEKVHAVINSQGFIMVEPLLNKVLNIGIEFVSENNKIQYFGKNYFITDSKGQYEGSYLNGLPQQDVQPQVVDFLQNHLFKTIDLLMQTLQESQLSSIYEGYFGVDMLIFYDKNNQLKIHPCLEINVRTTMGHVALSLEKMIEKNTQAIFKIFYHPKKTFCQFSKEMGAKYPLKINDSAIEKGYFALTDYDKSTNFGAYILAK